MSPGKRKPPVTCALNCSLHSAASARAGQLRYQELAIPEVGSPPVLLAKGPAVPFTAGAPISVWAPEQPGFQRFVGRSNFAWGHYPCEGSLRSVGVACLASSGVV